MTLLEVSVEIDGARLWYGPLVSARPRNGRISPQLHLSSACGLPRQSALAIQLKKSARKAILRINGMLPLEKGVNLAVRLSQTTHLQIPRIRQIERSAAVHREVRQPVDQCICLRSAIGRAYFVEVKDHCERIFSRCIRKSRFVVGSHIP